MCRLQFASEVHTQPSSDEPHRQHDAYADDCVEALLALAANNEMDFDTADLTAEPLSSFKGFPQHQQVHSVQADSKDSKDSSRYNCPYPGCKRSFQELWRLKVHFRAPPNIRGSGKERGHGMRLTHCPKCGAALKVGGHHVKCAAVPKEPASAGNGGSRRNRKAATTPRAEPMDPAMAAAMYTEPSYQQSQTAPTAGTAAAAAGASSKRSSAAYMQYGLSDMLQQETSNGQSLWQKALQLHAQQQQQQQQLAEECETEHNAPYNAPLATSAKASNASLQRLASSDDSSSSRMVEATCSGGSGSGNDANYAPSSSSGYGSGSEDMDNQQQQQPLLSLYGSQAAPAAAAAAAAAAGEFAVPVKQEQVVMPAVPELQQQQPQQHPEAGQLLWQHMLLQHLQQHVQQTPGFSLPELIQVASALFGNKVDTLVSAFGLSGPSTAQCQEQAQLSQLVAALRQPDAETAAAAAAAAEPHAAAVGYAAYASIFGAGGK